MISRRVFVGFAGCAPCLIRAAKQQYRIGDLVEIVALPDYAFRHHSNRAFALHVALLYRCLGKRFRIVYIGDDGRPELDVTSVAAPLAGCIGSSISIEAQCLEVVSGAA
jgi:hypothetical protein